MKSILLSLGYRIAHRCSPRSSSRKELDPAQVEAAWRQRARPCASSGDGTTATARIERGLQFDDAACTVIAAHAIVAASVVRTAPETGLAAAVAGSTVAAHSAIAPQCAGARASI